MKTIAYCCPLVPPEWIAAHGMQPEWLVPAGRSAAHAMRGVCPYAGALLADAKSARSASAVVLTTRCDQMRRMAGLIEGTGRVKVFLMNVPATWQTGAARQLYKDELVRLGRFLDALGDHEGGPDNLLYCSRKEVAGVRSTGFSRNPAEKPPKGGTTNGSFLSAGSVSGCRRHERFPDRSLSAVMFDYQQARLSLCGARTSMPARRFAEAVLEVRGGRFAVPTPLDSPPPGDGIPLALVGGPLLPCDHEIFDMVQRAGGSIVLDATETGERTLPPPFDARRMADDPLESLVDAYFLGIPDVFRRPNDGLYDWLGRQMAARGVRGVVFRRYLWCDLWHAEFHRLKQWSPVPVLEIDVADDDESVTCRTLGRIEAFLEMLR